METRQLIKAGEGKPRTLIKAKKATNTQPIQRVKKREGNFITNAPSNIGALVRGEVSIGDVAKEIPGTLAKVPEVISPATTEFFKTTGGILGEGLAYATSKDVREQYKKGNLDILPNVTDNTVKSVAKKTLATMIEQTILKSLPPTLKQSVITRAGSGAVQGVGFAIAEGLAKDKSKDEIIKDMKAYGIGGSVINTVLPTLGPLLGKLKSNPEVKKILTNESKHIVKTTPEIEPSNLVRDTNVTKDVSKITPDSEVKVSSARLPVDGVDVNARLERRLSDVAETKQTIKNNLGDKLDVATDVEQKKLANEVIKKMSPEKVDRVLRGIDPTPDGVLDTAFLHAAENLAESINSPGLVRRIASNLGKRAGQEIQFLKNFDEMSPAKNVAKIIAVREKELLRTNKGAKTISNVIKKETKSFDKTKVRVKISEAEKLIDELVC